MKSLLARWKEIPIAIYAVGVIATYAYLVLERGNPFTNWSLMYDIMAAFPRAAIWPLYWALRLGWFG